MKRKGIIIATIIPLLLVGCKESENKLAYEESQTKAVSMYTTKEIEDFKKEVAYNFKFKNKQDYKLENLKLEFAKQPYAILCDNDFILISDIKKNCIFKVGYDGKLIETIGKTGSGDTEFSYPADIKKFNEKYYILDSRNNRVKIYDKDLKPIENIKLGLEDKLEFTSEKLIFENLCVTDKGFFVNGINTDFDNLSFYDFNTKKITEYGVPFYGSMNYYNGKVYGVNSYLKTYNKKGDQFNQEMGISDLYEISIDKPELKKIDRLEGVFFDTDFYIEDNEIISFDASFGKITRNALDGKYKSSIGGDNDKLKEGSGRISHSKDGNIYCLNGVDKNLYIFKNKN